FPAGRLANLSGPSGPAATVRQVRRRHRHGRHAAVQTSGRTVTSAGKAESQGSDGALAGAPAARRLYREVASSPAAPRRAVVVGPGGSGKSVLLGALGALYEARSEEHTSELQSRENLV